MAMSQCPECGHAVSTNAKKCPSCGTGLNLNGELSVDAIFFGVAFIIGVVVFLSWLLGPD